MIETEYEGERKDRGYLNVKKLFNEKNYQSIFVKISMTKKIQLKKEIIIVQRSSMCHLTTNKVFFTQLFHCSQVRFGAFVADL